MIEKVVRLVNQQNEMLQKLLELLKKQNKFMINKDLYGLEDILDEIEKCSKDIAEVELQRRQILEKKNFDEFVRNNKDEELEKAYNNIKLTINLVKTQKESNELLLRQKLSFNTKMLEIMNPRREIRTYNSYGGLKK